MTRLNRQQATGEDWLVTYVHNYIANSMLLPNTFALYRSWFYLDSFAGSNISVEQWSRFSFNRQTVVLSMTKDRLSHRLCMIGNMISIDSDIYRRFLNSFPERSE